MDAFPLILGTRQWCLISAFLFDIFLEVLASTIKEEKESNKRHLDLLANNIIIFLENPAVSTLELVEQASKFSKAEEYKIDTHTQLRFYILVTNNWKLKWKLTTVRNSMWKYKIGIHLRKDGQNLHIEN